MISWLLLVLALLAAGCGRAPGPSEPTAVPVTVGTVQQKTVPLELGAIGTVVGSQRVGVTSRVTGQLLSVHFAPGEEVQAGQLLLQLDPAPFAAAVRQAAAALARDRAQLAKAELDQRRYAALVARDLASRDQYDQTRMQAAMLRAAVEAGQAALERARLDLAYSSLRAPLDGRAGELLVDPGNMVQANDTQPLVTIERLRPIDVRFALPERFTSEALRRQALAGPLTVLAVLRDQGDAPPERGTLLLVDNTVNPATGTIMLRARFPNLLSRLWPGQFVEIVLVLGERPAALVVPSQAVVVGPRGDQVWVVRDDATVELRQVVVTRTVRGESVVEQGLAAGERVVTDGQLRLTPGARVEEQREEPEGPATPAPAPVPEGLPDGRPRPAGGSAEPPAPPAPRPSTPPGPGPQR